MVIKNKKGWIKVLEVFVAILLMTGVIVIVLSNVTPNKDVAKQVSNMEITILREIQLSPQLRDEVLNANLPVTWENFDTSMPLTKEKIIDGKFPSIDCEAKLCDLNSQCNMDTNINKNIYAESVIIAADTDIYSPRQIKLFCWER